MGCFASSLHVRADSAERVSDEIIALLRARGSRLADAPGGGKRPRGRRAAERNLWITAPRDGWVSVLDSAFVSTDLAEPLSAALGAFALQVYVNDSDSWGYELFSNGAHVDGFDSEQAGENDGESDAADDEDADFDGEHDAAADDEGEEDAARAAGGGGQTAWGASPLAGAFGGALGGVFNTEAFTKQIQEMQRRMEELMPPEAREIRDRMARGQAAPQDVARYAEAMRLVMPQLLGRGGFDLSSLIGGLSGAVPRFRPTLADLEDDVEEEDLDGDDVTNEGEDEEFAEAEVECGAEDEREGEYEYEEDNQDEEDALDEEEALDEGRADEASLDEHVAALRELLNAPGDARLVRRVLAKQAVFAEETLAEFLPLVGVCDFYAHLSYEHLQEATPAELRQQRVDLHRRLCFEG